MLHRALASLVAVLGVAALALGIASATLWRPSDTLVAEAVAAPGTTLLMTDPGVLTMADPEVTIRATGDDVVIALGRTADVEAWVGRDAHTRVAGLADWNVLATQDVAARSEPAEPGAGEPTVPDGGEAIDEPAEPPADDAAEEPGTPEEGEPDDATEEEGAAEAPEPKPAPPDPRGSDLWWAEVSGGTSAEMEWAETDGRWSVLVAATGAGAGAPGIALTWPQEVVTPWLLPGVFVGALLLMIGLAWWALILVAQRQQTRAISEPEAVAEPTAPLTRRQLREAAGAQERRRARPRERDSIADRFPMLVPSPRKTPVATPTPPQEPTSTPTPAQAPTAGEGTAAGRVAVESPEVADGAGPRRRFSLPTLARRVRTEPSDAPDEQGSPEARRGRRSRGARGRSTAEVGSLPDQGGPQQPLPLSPPGAPAASADAWRRAWGLKESDDDSTNRGGDR